MDVRTYSNKVLSAAIGIDQHKRGREIDPEYERAIEDLSDYFFELSKIKDLEFPSEELFLANFYWPSNTFPNENLRGKKLDDLRVHSWLFAKDLSTFKEASRNKQENLIHLCCELSKSLMLERGYKRRLAA